jgi:hypothetical protein
MHCHRNSGVNSFAGASIELAGSFRGVDEAGHDLFLIQRTAGPILFGEYFEAPTGANENDFNIEIGAFGFANPENAGNPDPNARQRFSAEECSAAKQLIQSYFSNPSVVLDRWQSMPEVRFLGGVRFRPDWIIPDS